MKRNPLFGKSLECWFIFYKHHTGQSYVMDAKSGMHLKQLLKKVEYKVKERNMEPSEENIVNSLKGLLNAINDQWILDHLDISIVNSKFNVIYSKAVRNNPFTAADRINDIVEKRNSERTG